MGLKNAPISFTLCVGTSVALQYENRLMDFDETGYMAALPENCRCFIVKVMDVLREYMKVFLP